MHQQGNPCPDGATPPDGAIVPDGATTPHSATPSAGALPSAGAPSSDPDRELLRRLRKARNDLERFEVFLDRLIDDRAARLLFLPALPVGALEGAVARPVKFVRGFALVRIEKKSGRHVFEIDGKRLILPQVLGETLVELAANGGESFDDGVGWKSVARLTEVLKVSTGGLNSRLTRLRDKLDAHPPLSRELLQRDDDHGLRFARIRDEVEER